MIRTIAVLGAGTMGRGIAHAAITGEFMTRLFDVSPAALDKAREEIGALVAKGVELGKVSRAEAAPILDRLQVTLDLGVALADADLVIEAAPERLDVKMALLADVGRRAPQGAVIASNTSALSVTEMAGHKMRLVEVVRALESAPETLAAIEDVARRMGKETVLVREAPGFITSRVNALIGNEAFYLLQEGIASARDIDKALKLGLNHPMGPFELVDLVGLDTRLSVLEYLHRTLGEKYRPCPLLVDYVQAGRLGRKVGRGVYEY